LFVKPVLTCHWSFFRCCRGTPRKDSKQARQNGTRELVLLLCRPLMCWRRPSGTTSEVASSPLMPRCTHVFFHLHIVAHWRPLCCLPPLLRPHLLACDLDGCVLAESVVIRLTQFWCHHVFRYVTRGDSPSSSLTRVSCCAVLILVGAFTILSLLPAIFSLYGCLFWRMIEPNSLAQLLCCCHALYRAAMARMVLLRPQEVATGRVCVCVH